MTDTAEPINHYVLLVDGERYAEGSEYRTILHMFRMLQHDERVTVATIYNSTALRFIMVKDMLRNKDGTVTICEFPNGRDAEPTT